MIEPSIRTTGEFGRRFGVVAKRIGSDRELRAMTHTFGLSTSLEEALRHIERRMRGDKEFRDKWRGWSFFCVDVSASVKVSDEGVVMVVKGDREVMMVKGG